MVVTSNQTYATILVVLTVDASPAITIAGVGNNFSGSTTAAPGEMVAVFGTRMAPSNAGSIATTLPLPYSLNGVSATVNGVSAPMYYVSPGQIDLQIPYETGAGPAVLGLNNNGQVASFPLQVAATAPGLYPATIDALTGAVSTTVKQNQYSDFVYHRLEGDVTRRPWRREARRHRRSTIRRSIRTPRQPVTVSIGGVPAVVAFAGIPYGIAAEMQINITVPANAPLGQQPLIVSVGGIQSQSLMLTVTQ